MQHSTFTPIEVSMTEIMLTCNACGEEMRAAVAGLHTCALKTRQELEDELYAAKMRIRDLETALAEAETEIEAAQTALDDELALPNG